MELSFQTTVTPKLYRTMVYFQLFHSKMRSIPFMIVAAAMSVVTVAAKFLGFFEPEPFVFWACLGYSVLVVFFVPFMESQIRSTIKSGRTMVGRSHRMVLNDAGIASYAEGGASAQFSWNKLAEAHELKTAFLFYINSQQALALAKEELTAQQCQQIRELGQQKLKEKYLIHYK